MQKFNNFILALLGTIGVFSSAIALDFILSFYIESTDTINAIFTLWLLIGLVMSIFFTKRRTAENTFWNGFLIFGLAASFAFDILHGCKILFSSVENDVIIGFLI
jgi:uncharacterized membrane protein